MPQVVQSLNISVSKSGTHWGGWHSRYVSLGYRELAALYPRFGDFCALRRELDPRGRFLNDHLRRLFLAEGTA